MFRKFIFMMVVTAMSLMTSVQGADAAINLSINPAEGGSTLRLGRLGTSNIIDKQVRIRISSSEGTQYQVFQRMVETLVNEEGKNLDAGAIGTYTLTGSNSSGTLYAQNLEPMGLGDQLIYTSSPSGEGDSFTVIYSVRPERVNVQGNFLGKILYLVRPVGGGSQDQAFLTVTLEAKSNLKASLKSSVGKDTLRLDSDKNLDKAEPLEISFEDNTGEIKIYQELESFPQNELFEEVGKELIRFSTASTNSEQVYHPTSSILERRRELIYSSPSPGDTITLSFSLDSKDVDQQKAGLYRGRLKYILESESSQRELPVDLEVNIKPIFVLDVSLPAEGVKFNNLLPSTPPQFHEVNVSVKTNLGKPYMVIQNMVSPLVNQKGDEVDQKAFTMKTELVNGQKGRVAFGDFQPISTGEKAIFYSDSKGSASEFKVTYRLQSYPEINPGDYSTSIVYSLGEL